MLRGRRQRRARPQEHDYFHLVLSLREKLDVHTILEGQGIHPEGTTTWLDVKRTLEAVFGNSIEIGCNFDGKGTRQLYEVPSPP